MLTSCIYLRQKYKSWRNTQLFICDVRTSMNCFNSLFQKSQLFFFFALLLSSASSPAYGSEAGKADHWLDIVRQSPYNITKDFYRNIKFIRRWVLLQEGFCEKPDRHILFNRRGHFLGYINNQATPQLTQEKLNKQRRQFAEAGRVTAWVKGDRESTGYPFALACEQPHVEMNAALQRMTGKYADDRIWGSWNGIQVGSKSAPVPLTNTVLQIYQQRNSTYQFNDSILKDLLGQILIESGARKYSHSSANATGLLQLLPAVIRDCQIPKAYVNHRIAQVDCALKLYRQNDRNLAPVFEQRFGRLPKFKKDKLYAMLLVQAYHGGIGRISALLKDDLQGKASIHFSKNHTAYSAEEIALGLIFHNLGRNNLGMASLYYLVDVEIASEELCRQKSVKQAEFCRS
jgi:hypothetical protein